MGWGKYSFMASMGSWNEVFFAPFVAWILHLYFDLFSGFIQTTVFIFLTMLFVGQEAPEDDTYELQMKKGGK